MDNISNKTGRNLILPTAYAESLSYLEQLQLLCNKMNEIIDTVNDLQERVKRLEDK